MAYRLIFTNSFKKDLKRCEKRGLPMVKIFEAIKILTENGELPAEYKPHKLSGKRQANGNAISTDGPATGSWFGNRTMST